MMEGLSFKKYLQTTKKRFDPSALIISFGGIIAVLLSALSSDSLRSYYDFHSLVIVAGGTFACILFQYDFGSTFYTILLILRSFLGTPDKRVGQAITELDQAILQGTQLKDLREGQQLDGEILNDIVFMHRQGLLFEEIDAFVTSRIQDDYLARRIAVDILKRAGITAPALGLFGTVMGLIGVLKTLSDPTQIGSSMSLALMTTAYGAGLGSLVFNPLAGRLEHHNLIYLEIHQQVLSKLGILLRRDERTRDVEHEPLGEAA